MKHKIPSISLLALALSAVLLGGHPIPGGMEPPAGQTTEEPKDSEGVGSIQSLSDFDEVLSD